MFVSAHEKTTSKYHKNAIFADTATMSRFYYTISHNFVKTHIHTTLCLFIYCLHSTCFKDFLSMLVFFECYYPFIAFCSIVFFRIRCFCLCRTHSILRTIHHFCFLLFPMLFRSDVCSMHVYIVHTCVKSVLHSRSV